MAGPEQVQPAHGVGREAAPGEGRERHGVARRRVDGIDRGEAGRPVIGVIDPTARVEQRLGIGRQDGVRAEGPDLPDQVLAEGEVVDERAVGLVQEADTGIPDDLRRRALLGLAQGRELEWIGVRVLATLVTGGATDEPPDRTLLDPRRGGARRPELGIVGMRGDEHEPLWSPAVGLPGGGRSRHEATPGTLARARNVLRAFGHAGTLPAEASLVSPHGRSLFRRDPRVDAHRTAARSVSSLAVTSAAWPSGLTFGQTQAIRPAGIDQEGRPRRSHVRLAVVLLLDPGPVRLDGHAGLVGEQRERQVVLRGERLLARGTLRTDAPHIRLAPGKALVVVAERTGLGGAAGGVVLGVEIQDRPAATLLAQAMDRPGGVRQRELGREVADGGHLHGAMVAGDSMTRS